MLMKRNIIQKSLAVFFSLYFFISNSYSQCCAGGSGSPIAGGASQGVLQERQIELNTNIQFIYSDKFYKKDKQDTNKTFNSFGSSYEYFRLAYGVSKNLTMSIESGYFFNKKETGLLSDPTTTYQTKGIGDLILFPRYDIINWTEEKHRTELTLGMGYKIPLGSFNDSSLAGYAFPYPGYSYPGRAIYVTKPTSVQLSSGAQDIIFYTFLFRGYTEQNFRIFANAMYIKKGWNPNGEKLGDFASVGLFAGKSFFNHLGITLQARYEKVNHMQINENILLYGNPSNYYPEATGYQKVFLSPQVSIIYNNFTVYISKDFAIYQYLNTSPYYTQVGSKDMTTVGLSYRFFTVKSNIKDQNGDAEYYCTMCPEVKSAKPGNCPNCGMKLKKKENKIK
jgi:hypothetical protein